MSKQNTAEVFGVLIQRDPSSSYQAYTGWDALHETKKSADESAAKANKLFHGAKVVTMTREEAAANGWS